MSILAPFLCVEKNKDQKNIYEKLKGQKLNIERTGFICILYMFSVVKICFKGHVQNNNENKNRKKSTTFLPDNLTKQKN